MATHEQKTMSDKEEEQQADALRALAHQTVSKTHKEWFVQSGAIDGNFKDYCKRMKDPTFFGGEVELLALSFAMQRAISVFMPHQLGGYRAIAEYGQDFMDRARLVCVLYNGHNHYDCLI